LNPKGPAVAGHAPLPQANVPETYRRHIVDYTRKEAPAALVDSDARYLTNVMPRKAIRSGVAWVRSAGFLRRRYGWPHGRMAGLGSDAGIQERLGPYPKRIPGGAANPLARGRSISTRATRTPCYRIHGTNQPEYIGQAISSGCIRMTNEDVIDLFERVRTGATVVVLPPAGQRDGRPFAVAGLIKARL